MLTHVFQNLMVTLIQNLIQRRICRSSPILVVGSTFFFFKILRVAHLICFVPSDVGKSELQTIQAAKPDGTAAKQVKIVEPNKAEVTDEDVDKDTSSDDDSSDEDDVSEA